MKSLEAASELLSKVLRLGFEGDGLERADGGGGGGFDGMVEYEVEELIVARVEDGRSECCTCVSNL